jgi:hypothetical protein
MWELIVLRKRLERIYKFQPRNNLEMDENGDPLSDSHNILNRWKNYFSLIECAQCH